MKHLLFLLFFSAAIGANAQSTNLEGTKWLMACDGCDIPPYTIIFLADGEVDFIDYGGNDGSEEHWKQRGNKVTISYSNGYAIYKGVITADLITGTAKNKPGKTWGWSCSRITD